MALPQASSGLHIGAAAWYACWKLQALDDTKPSVDANPPSLLPDLATKCDNKALIRLTAELC
ncbi:hypothetical protein EMCG_01359 [[Emmonsia] crescens]|uniref:Uncharacterized protein n=1 Tax=[Emmonsia] crescens TaxID=73230 RepID=A0A0G2J9W1_9EURO|nr:hypothetical protein EMCG_01359 [Emmonsia crescens UAMH 3008]